MEKINNMASAAAQAVWGENSSKQEPVSGKTGDVSKGEPYDAGNIEENERTEKPSVTTGPATTSTSTKSTAGGAGPDTTAPATTETADESTTASKTANPANTQDSSVTATDSTHLQNDTRDPSNPQTKPEAAAPKENVDDSTGGPDTSDNPVKVDGPGPKPIDEVARANGGDAGNMKSSEDVAASGADAAAEGNEEEEEEEEEEGPRAKSKGHGTGEQYVKSTGLKADGGDFDATKPGAGREADRLMEEMGMHHEPGPGAPSATHESVGNNEGDDEAGKKPKLTERIKAKFHKN